MHRFDVAIIGAGLMGCFTARHLASRGYSVALLERENDVSMGISRANTAVVYAGYDMKPGTLKAKLVVKANEEFGELCEELCVDFERTGSLMLGTGPRSAAVLQSKLAQGQQNGVPGLQLLGAEELQSLEPGVSTSATTALFAPTTGTVNPWQLCLAAAQDAQKKGASFFFEHEVIAIESKGSSLDTPEGYLLSCCNGAQFFATVVVNCAGICADRVSELVAPVSFRLELSSGSYLVLDTVAKECINRVVFFEPEEKGKGATFVPTTEGNILLGPSEEWLDTIDVEPGYITTEPGLSFVRAQSEAVFPSLPLATTIRSFGTLRPNIRHAKRLSDGSVLVSDTSIHDLHIAWAEGAAGFLNIAGVKTPGLTCADKIGEYAADMVEGYFAGEAGRFGWGEVGECARDGKGRIPRYARNDIRDAQNDNVGDGTVGGDIIAGSRAFADEEIICRCRQVTAKEVRAAIRAELGARTVDGVKRRVGCGLGRCQGGFCMERVMLLLAEELGGDASCVVKDRGGTWVVRTSTVVGEGVQNGSGRIPRYARNDIRGVRDDKKGDNRGDGVAGSAQGGDRKSVQLLIIGGGAAGLAAGCSAVSAGVAPEEILLVDRLDALGGILPQCSHRGFGMREQGGTLTGQEFLAPLLDEFHATGIPAFLSTTVISLTPSNGQGGTDTLDAPVSCANESLLASTSGKADNEPLLQHHLKSLVPPTATAHGEHQQPVMRKPLANVTATLSGPQGVQTVQAQAVIFATGCREQAIGALPIVGTRPSGIFTAGAAQRMVNIQQWDIGKRIVVLGSGDVGMIMAGTLTDQGKHVLAIVEQANTVGGLKANKKRYIDNLDIPLLTNTTISQVYGHRRIEAVELETKLPSGETTSRLLECDTLIVSTGLIPERELLRGILAAQSAEPSTLSRQKNARVPDVPEDIPWLFSAGNARKVQRFIEAVVSDGHSAGVRAGEYLSALFV